MFVFDAKPSTGVPEAAPAPVRGEDSEIKALRDRVRALESALITPASRSFGRQYGPGVDREKENRDDDDIQPLAENCFRRKNGKTRFYGRSHWILTMSYFHDVREFLEFVHQTKRKSAGESQSEYHKLKQLKAEISSKKRQEYQLPSHLQAFRLHEILPGREIADQLLHLYLSTFETTYRVLHVPKFLEEYNAYWAGSQGENAAFTAKLLALMACSTCFYNPGDGESPEADVSLNKTAHGWALAVQSWVFSTLGKERINIDTVQIQCLLRIAGEANGFEGELGWVSSGSLVRNAMMMGLHRDPCHFPRVSKYYAEIRRRLWTTIVELDMQAALRNGMPPFISLDSYDTVLPVNIDDEKLSETMVDDPVPTDLATNFTRTSFQLILAQSLPIRMRISKLVNALKFDSDYDEALELSQALTEKLHTVPFYFRDDGNIKSFHGVPNSFTFPISLLRLVIHQSLLVLHRPFAFGFSKGRGGPAQFFYSRKICTESCLALLAPLTSMAPDFPRFSPQILRLKGRMLQEELLHAALTICLELKSATDDVGLPALPSDGNMIRTSFGEFTDSQQEAMIRAVESTIDYFANKVQRDKEECKSFLFLGLALASARRRLFHASTQVIPYFQAVCIRGIMQNKALLGGASWAELKHDMDNSQPGVVDNEPDGTYAGTGQGEMLQTPATSLDENFFLDFDVSNLIDMPEFGISDLQNIGFL